MVTSLTNMTGWIARFVLSATVLCFNGPLLMVPAERTHGTATEQMNTQSEASGKGEFHATVTIGRGKKQITVEFGSAGERSEDEAL
jgi:hypothetical protein